MVIYGDRAASSGQQGGQKAQPHAPLILQLQTNHTSFPPPSSTNCCLLFPGSLNQSSGFIKATFCAGSFADWSLVANDQQQRRSSSSIVPSPAVSIPLLYH